ncbi:hypothetical protein PVAP13_9NG456084 [Panicum virgatum]|uniref:Uncharacterized protein n=1 Tax=Panicum virgatum TaxID=38727 RepID=A0A8T0MSB1_PANVG|nr:hypothetical protein PVAP13_9NG456084 [Panicum virgatum]
MKAKAIPFIAYEHKRKQRGQARAWDPGGYDEGGVCAKHVTRLPTEGRHRRVLHQELPRPTQQQLRHWGRLARTGQREQIRQGRVRWRHAHTGRKEAAAGRGGRGGGLRYQPEGDGCVKEAGSAGKR